MKTAHSYYDQDYAQSRLHFAVPPILEGAYSGEQIVAWYGNIERQISGMIDDYEAGRNRSYVDKLVAYLRTWRDNQITGSINRETLDPLESAANQLAVDSWKLNNYFGNLRDNIRKLIASEEQLPRTEEPPAPAGGAGGPPPAPSGDFGPEEDQPPGEGDLEPPPEGDEGDLEPPPGGVPPPPGGAVPRRKPLKRWNQQK